MTRAVTRPLLAIAFGLLCAACAGSLIIGFAAATLHFMFTGGAI